MRVTVLSLKGIQFEGEATVVTAKTQSGEISVLDHHLPLITALAAGDLVIKLPDDKEKRVPAKSGFLHVDDKNTLTALID